MTVTLSEAGRLRIGVWGGSFDPTHVGHLIMAESVREALSLDMVLFVPVGEQPLKVGLPITPAVHRLAMVELAIEGNPSFRLSRVDVDRPGPSYTYDTLAALRREWGGPEAVSMWFIMGADSLASFPRWHKPHEIVAEVRLAVVRRPGVALDLPSLYSQIPGLEHSVDWVYAPLVGITATDVRRRLSQEQSVRYRVPREVEEYIQANGLYTQDAEG
ncbi:MAG: nicotinate-nucleotide adenylyltransferase [Chloroflexota bacterium]|nr:nicotinate-nucleotide adenylyltransferase [Chloroflexota bacterium]